MTKIIATLIVFLYFFSFESVAQNKDNFEHLISKLQDKDSQELVYTVQLGAFNKSPKEGHFNTVENLFSHTYRDGMTRFFTKLFTSVESAIAHRNNMRLVGYPDAFVLAMDGGFDRILIEVD